MIGKYVQPGKNLDYTNTGSDTIAAGTVVSLTTRVGIAAGDIAAGATGALAVEGVFAFAKDSAAINLGAAVYYNATNSVMTATATSNVPAGYAVAAAAAADTTVVVKLLG